MSLTEDGRPVCGSCGTTPRVRQYVYPLPLADDDGAVVLQPWSRPFTAAEYEQTARASGWRVGVLPGGVHDAMCPRCSRPDPALARVLAELRLSIGGTP